MYELTSFSLSGVILACAILSVILYFLGVTWPGVYVLIFGFTSLASFLAEVYWYWTAKKAEMSDKTGDSDDEYEGRHGGGGHAWGGGPHDEQPVNAAPSPVVQEYYKKTDSLAKLATKTPSVEPRTGVKPLPDDFEDNFNDLTRR